jgi:hypothetical protein
LCVVQREVEVELQKASGVELIGIDNPDMRAVEEQAPLCRAPDRFGHREPPTRIEPLSPRRQHQHNWLWPGANRRDERRTKAGNRRGFLEA